MEAHSSEVFVIGLTVFFLACIIGYYVVCGPTWTHWQPKQSLLVSPVGPFGKEEGVEQFGVVLFYPPSVPGRSFGMLFETFWIVFGSCWNHFGVNFRPIGGPNRATFERRSNLCRSGAHYETIRTLWKPSWDDFGPPGFPK